MDRRAIVIDNGSETCRAGFAGYELPNTIFPSIVGRPRNKSSRELCIGAEADDRRNELFVKYPIEHSIVSNWDDMETIWHHTFYSELRVVPEEQAVLLTEAPLNPKANREKMTQIMFETFDVPYMYTCCQSVLSLLASGHTTGVVLQSGSGMPCIVPVYEGHVLPRSVCKYMVAGYELTDYLMRLLTEKGHSFTTRADRDSAGKMKDQLCYVAQDYKLELEEASKPHNSIAATYTIPDGKDITIGSERFTTTEALFDPPRMGLEFNGAHECIVHAIDRCNIDLRSDMYSNVCLSGGSTMFDGFASRLEHEIQTLLSKRSDHETEVKVIGAKDRCLSAWSGGSIMASQPDFLSMCISKDEYDEYGPTMVHKKCF